MLRPKSSFYFISRIHLAILFLNQEVEFLELLAVLFQTMRLHMDFLQTWQNLAKKKKTAVGRCMWGMAKKTFLCIYIPDTQKDKGQGCSCLGEVPDRGSPYFISNHFDLKIGHQSLHASFQQRKNINVNCIPKYPCVGVCISGRERSSSK